MRPDHNTVGFNIKNQRYSAALVEMHSHMYCHWDVWGGLRQTWQQMLGSASHLNSTIAEATCDCWETQNAVRGDGRHKAPCISQPHS